jgi:ATP/maltotriose-dependent transcriptional regulator MalT
MLHTYLQPWPTMTTREIEVAKLIYRGYSNEAIAHELKISVATVKTHVHNLLVKFNVRSRWVLRDILASMGGFE